MLLGIFSFLFSIAFWAGTSNAAATPRWDLIACAVPLMLFFIRIRITAGHLAYGVLLLAAACSVSWAMVRYDAVNTLGLLCFLGGVFAVAAAQPSLRPVWAGCALGLIVNAGVLVAQRFEWLAWPEVVPPGGLFMNVNLGSEFAALILVAVAAERMWWFLPGPLASLALQHNRGAVVAIAVAAAAYLYRFNRLAAVLLVSLTVGGGLIYTAAGDLNASAEQRLRIWSDTIDGLTWTGRGIGSFYSTYPDKATREDTLMARPDHAHNDLLELTYEIGPGVIAFIAFLWLSLRVNLLTERLVLWAFLVEGLFGFPLTMPATGVVFAAVAGRLCGAGPALRSDLQRGRVVLRRRLLAFRDRRGVDDPFEGSRAGVPPELPFPVRSGLSRRVDSYADHSKGHSWDG